MPEPVRSEDGMAARAVFDLTGRVAIVTGASGALGRRFAEVLGAAGAATVLAARRTDRMAAIAQCLPRAIAVECDVTVPEQRQGLVSRTLEVFGRIDVLVNNAGISGPSVPPEDYLSERWARTIDVNLSGLFGLTQLVGREMLARGGGSVINIASIMGLVSAMPMTDAAYAASKGAVVSLTRELGVAWARRGVRVNAIAPGWFPSEMTAGMVDDDRSQEFIRRGCPMGRMGEARELDGALLFLASGASTYCTGQTLAIDGGWTAR
jgi:NAD(P)-dependent dehydrogenase (short-subunit alcohol dehydrogenase family)